ncbi:MAG: DNA-directed RNA polymerase subunit omega [Clostridiales bacterium]|nr:DNA-directed RNA polymerase subunit omega [Clostridiales bacterium]
MSIVDPNILDLLQHSDSRYTLVVEASKRGRQIVGGSQPLIDNTGMKPLKTAVEEINRGMIAYDRPAEEESNAL